MERMGRVVGLSCALVLIAGARARADEPARPHAAYVELLGKGALWGAGYDYQPSRWLAFGAAASYFVVRGERVATVSPYVGVYPIGHGRHRLFAHAGPMIVHKETPSPVPEWPGQSETGVAAELSVGYELRARVLFRVCAMGTAGRGGVYPWLGASLGWTL